MGAFLKLNLKVYWFLKLINKISNNYYLKKIMLNKKRKKIIELFEKAQSVPYFLFKHRDSSKLFDLNKGCCAEKLIWLGSKLKEMKIPVKYYLIEFNWKDLPIPEEIIKLRKKEKEQHLALKAKLDKKWIWIDPTWDLSLEKIGFPVTRNWHGKTNTKLAVKPLKIKEFEPIDFSEIELDDFTKSLNKYFEKIR